MFVFIFLICTGMERLDTLSLNHNVMTELGPGWFEGKLYVVIILIQISEVARLFTRTLLCTGLNRLTSLSLDYNKIVSIDPDAFKGLEGTTLTTGYVEKHLLIKWVTGTTLIDISQYRLLFGFSLLYTDRIPFELLDSAALL
jgi:hypothetical protein